MMNSNSVAKPVVLEGIVSTVYTHAWVLDTHYELQGKKVLVKRYFSVYVDTRKVSS